jgi:hypothetical protein
MNKAAWCKLAAAALLCGVTGMASAKLPAPPPADPVKAEEAKKKAAETAKKEAELMAKAQDRAVERYKREKKGGAQPVAVSAKKKQ